MPIMGGTPTYQQASTPQAQAGAAGAIHGYAPSPLGRLRLGKTSFEGGGEGFTPRGLLRQQLATYYSGGPTSGAEGSTQAAPTGGGFGGEEFPPLPFEGGASPVTTPKVQAPSARMAGLQAAAQDRGGGVVERGGPGPLASDIGGRVYPRSGMELAARRRIY